MEDGQQDAQRDAASDKPSFTVLAPAIALPKGGGAIRGIGEKFAANPVTGSARFSIPLPASPGRGGFGPELTLSYDSGSGNGAFGFGWSVPLPAISRAIIPTQQAVIYLPARRSPPPRNSLPFACSRQCSKSSGYPTQSV